MNGDTSTYHGYATDVITDEAIKWLDGRDKNKPFLLHLHHKAPHRYFFAPLKYIDNSITKHSLNRRHCTSIQPDMALHGGCKP